MQLDYFNQCDRWRIGNSEGERLWHLMINNASMISNESMIKSACLSDILDEEEDLSDFMASDSGSACYRSSFEGITVLYVQSCGFEFIFTEDGKSPESLIASASKDNDIGLNL